MSAKFGLERDIARRMRLVGIERGGDVACADDGGQNVGRLRRLLVVFDVGADARPVHAADCGVMRVSDDRHGQLDLGIGESCRIADRREIRHRIVGGIEPVGIDMAEISDRRIGARIGLAVGDPDRRVVAAGIERVDLTADLLVADDVVEFAAGEIVQLVGDRRIAATTATRLLPGLVRRLPQALPGMRRSRRGAAGAAALVRGLVGLLRRSRPAEPSRRQASGSVTARIRRRRISCRRHWVRQARRRRQP